MASRDSIAYVCFPPLTTVIGLASVPARVGSLLAGRWMAEAAAGAPAEPAFLIRWQTGGGPFEAADGATSAVEWRPEGPSGSLCNAGGQIVLAPEGEGSLVDLRPGALERPASLEPLVEAALADALAVGGECFLHGAAVELDGRRPLLVGDSGAGKSTVALAAAACGGRIISDDSLLLGRADGRPLVRAARRNAWLRPGSAALLPSLRRRGIEVEPAPDGRFRLDRERYPESFRISTYPDSLVLLGRDPDEAGLSTRPLTQAEALTALLRGTSALYLTDARFTRRGRLLLALLTFFTEQLPAIELRIGSSLLATTEECLAAVVESLP